MSIVRDESLRDHAWLVRASYDAHAESLAELSEAGLTTGDAADFKGTELGQAGPWGSLPSEVSDAKEEYEAALKVRLKFLKYTRSRNGELVDAVDDGEPLPKDPVQLTRSITVSSTQGAVVILEQWLAEALPAEAGENVGEA